MATTIQISDDVKKTLDKMRVFERETYNEVIENMIEDQMEINEKTKKDLDEAKKRIDGGKFVPLEEVEKKYGL
jgi:predicted transcriptional regulator